MARKRVRLLKRVPPMIGVCEGRLVQFNPLSPCMSLRKRKLKSVFAGHKCVQADLSAAGMHKAR